MHDIDPSEPEVPMAARNAFGSDEEFEFEMFDDGEFEFESEWEYEAELPFDESEELVLAEELLQITDDVELEQFLGKIFKRVGRGIKKFAKSSAGRALGGALKGIAKRALPTLGGALGSFIPIPGVGTAVGTALGRAAASRLEFEFEGLDPDEQELEVARRFVRLAGAAANKVADMPPTSNPKEAAKAALKSAANQVSATASRSRKSGIRRGGRRGRSGRWVRRGNRIILIGV